MNNWLQKLFGDPWGRITLGSILVAPFVWIGEVAIALTDILNDE